MIDSAHTVRLKELTVDWIHRLRRAGVYNPEADMQRIVTLVFGNAPALEFHVPADARTRIEEVVVRRERREPLARILGYVEFHGLTIRTHEGVFRPYPETEAVVDVVLDHFRNRDAALRVLDVGTGSGCLLLAVLNAYPRATGIGVDIDPLAVAAARENAARLELVDHAEFRECDWLTGLVERFDLLISNPPRVPSGMTAHLLPEMKDHDPLAGIDGGPDGLEYFRRLADGFEQVCTSGGCGIFQVSDAEAVRRIFMQRTRADLSVHNNFVGIPTCVKAVVQSSRRDRNWRIKDLFG